MDIIYNKIEEKLPELPLMIIVHLESYTGPQCFDDEARKNWLPIIASESYSQCLNAKRSQYPLKLAYAMTVHKSQGETLTKGVIDFGSVERCLGSSYVQITRFKRFTDFLLIPFAYDRITERITSLSMLKERKVEENRLKNLSNETIKKYSNLLPQPFLN